MNHLCLGSLFISQVKCVASHLRDAHLWGQEQILEDYPANTKLLELWVLFLSFWSSQVLPIGCLIVGGALCFIAKSLCGPSHGAINVCMLAQVFLSVCACVCVCPGQRSQSLFRNNRRARSLWPHADPTEPLSAASCWCCSLMDICYSVGADRS